MVEDIGKLCHKHDMPLSPSISAMPNIAPKHLSEVHEGTGDLLSRRDFLNTFVL